MESDTKALNQTGDEPLIRRVRRNIKQMRFTPLEFSGCLGDMGTFLPLALAMGLVAGMDLGAIFIFAGLFNIASGLMFGLPIPVQPMKAIAAVAIAEQMLPGEIAAAGLIAGAILLLLGSSGLIEKATRLVPKPIIRGIQVGVGLKLAIKGVTTISGTPIFGFDSILLAIGSALLLLIAMRSKRFPAAILLFGVGILIMFTAGGATPLTTDWNLPRLSFLLPDSSEWLGGLLRGTLPQIPLTLLNSVMAVCLLSSDLFGSRGVSNRKMTTTVGLMNLIGCGFGGMPMCHGSGGLAAQYHFGARTGGAVVMLGTMFLLTGLFLGDGASRWLQLFPVSILGVMLFFAGLELTLAGRDQNSRRGFFIMMVTAGGIIALNAAVGFALGLTTAMLTSERAVKEKDSGKD